jgi:carbon-monoxide dehydrogenase medium subunit
MKPFGLAEPASLKDAIAMIGDADSGVRPIAGGSALMLMMKPGILQPETLVSLRGIEPRYSSIETAGDGGLFIGAMTTLRRMELSADVARHAPVVTQALRRLSNVRVRNIATLGGHLAHGDPHLDLPPVLIALGAKVHIAGRDGERQIDVEDLFRSYLETSLDSGELITRVTVPAQGNRKSAYIKHTTRSADDWPALGLAVSFSLDGDVLRDVRAAIGAATDIPQRLKSVETALEGKRAADALQGAGDAAAAEAQVHSDARGSAAYKRELIRVFTGRVIRKAMDSAAGGTI